MKLERLTPAEQLPRVPGVVMAGMPAGPVTVVGKFVPKTHCSPSLGQASGNFAAVSAALVPAAAV